MTRAVQVDELAFGEELLKFTNVKTCKLELLDRRAGYKSKGRLGSSLIAGH